MVQAMELAAAIDHTLLAMDAQQGAVAALCQEAVTHGFAAVCVNGVWVSYCARQLAGTPVVVAGTAGFPLGQMTTASKLYEAEDILAAGAREIDFVINVGALLAGEEGLVAQEMVLLARAARRAGARTKAILETACLTETAKRTACRLAVDSGVDFVKTSTGFGPGGATLADVELMVQAVGDAAEVKASGGIRTRAQALAFLAAGATRIGTSRALAMMQEAEACAP